MNDRVEVVIDRPAFPGEVDAVEEAFAGIDADVTVESGYETRGVGDYPWVVFITLSGWTVAVFVKKVTELVAEDAYAALKRWIQSVTAARQRFRVTGGSIRSRMAASPSPCVMIYPTKPSGRWSTWISPPCSTALTWSGTPTPRSGDHSRAHTGDGSACPRRHRGRQAPIARRSARTQWITRCWRSAGPRVGL
jgi:hypothetical protein